MEPDGTEDEGERSKHPADNPIPPGYRNRSKCHSDPGRGPARSEPPSSSASMLAGSRRQSRVGRGSVARRIGVSLVFTTLASLPLGTALAIHWLLPERSSRRHRVRRVRRRAVVLLLIVMNLRPLHEAESRASRDHRGTAPDRLAELSAAGMGVRRCGSWTILRRRRTGDDWHS